MHRFKTSCFFLILLGSLVLLMASGRMVAQTLLVVPCLSFGAALASDPDPSSHAFGLSGNTGALFYLDFKNRLGLFSGALIEMRRFDRDVFAANMTSGQIRQVIITQTTVFLSAPIGLRLKLGKTKRWYVSCGTQWNRVFFTKSKIKGLTSTIRFEPASLAARVHQSELAVLGGIGYTFPIGTYSSLNLECRNSFGLSDRSQIFFFSKRLENTHCIQLSFCFGKK